MILSRAGSSLRTGFSRGGGVGAGAAPCPCCAPPCAGCGACAVGSLHPSAVMSRRQMPSFFMVLLTLKSVAGLWHQRRRCADEQVLVDPRLRGESLYATSERLGDHQHAIT